MEMYQQMGQALASSAQNQPDAALIFGLEDDAAVEVLAGLDLADWFVILFSGSTHRALATSSVVRIGPYTSRASAYSRTVPSSHQPHLLQRFSSTTEG